MLEGTEHSEILSNQAYCFEDTKSTMVYINILLLWHATKKQNILLYKSILNIFSGCITTI
jgi:hypothetical protein